MSMEKIASALSALGIRTEKELSLKPYISLRIDSVAALAVFPDTAEKFCKTLSLLREEGIRTEIIGNGTNLFFACEHFDGAVVFTRAMKSVTVVENKIHALCGAPLTSLSVTAAREGLSGLEFAYGIPASVGGAVYMNAGAYGGSVSDVLAESLCFDGHGTRVLSAAAHGFSYRKSSYMTSGYICVEATFELNFGERARIEEKMNENMASRREKQPLDRPNAGSYFKRPAGLFAAKLIDDCGLKGYLIGGAQVSEKHAGFIINAGGATARDVLMLEEEIKKRVFERFGVALEREVRVIE